jgi:hypothetical protein
MAITKDQQKAPEGAKPDAKAPKGKKDAPVDPDAELSEEDLELKKNLELMVARVSDKDPAVVKAALSAICNEIQSSTTAMSAVPKPLKFLVPHVDALRAAFEAMPPTGPNRPALADVLSVLASTVAGKEGERLGLRYKLAGSLDNLGQWGHEYLRHISGEVAEEFKVILECGCVAGVGLCGLSHGGSGNGWRQPPARQGEAWGRPRGPRPARCGCMRAAQQASASCPPLPQRPPPLRTRPQVRQEAGEPVKDLMTLVEQVRGGAAGRHGSAWLGRRGAPAWACGGGAAAAQGAVPRRSSRACAAAPAPAPAPRSRRTTCPTTPSLRRSTCCWRWSGWTCWRACATTRTTAGGLT